MCQIWHKTMKERDLEIAIGEALRRHRERAGYSQEELASELGVSRSTVVRTELGDGQPVKQFAALLKFWRVCNVPAKQGFQELINADDYRQAEAGSRSGQIKRLQDYLEDFAPDLIISEIDYHYFGGHGSDPEAVQQLVTAYLHLPLHMRHSISQMILADYRQAQRMGLDPCPEGTHPDLDLLQKAIDAGFQASMEGQEAYKIK